jgi:hypothetical protein
MASIITATVASGLTQSADNSGVLQLASGTGNLVTIPSVTGTAMVSGNMPTFSYYQSATQTLSTNTITKITFTSNDWDTTGGMFASSTFTPTVAGYYQVTCAMAMNTAGSGMVMYFYKNGSAFKKTTNLSGGLLSGVAGSALVSCNGSTDYIEIYAQISVGQSLVTGVTDTYFQGVLVRAA